MLKFFRNIRQNLIMENKTSKYLKYAVGEIVLVVIGILIALQLNNWNTERNRGQQEISLLREMRQNLEKDLVDCRHNYFDNQQYENGNRAVLKHLTDRTPFHDSLRLHYANLYGHTTLVANTSAFDNLKSIGFDLIGNDSLRRSITSLYSERYSYLKNLEFEADSKIQYELMVPSVNERIQIDTIFISAKPYDAQALMDDRVFMGLLRTNLFFREWMVKMYGNTEQRILNLMQLIDQELNSRSS